MNVEKLLAVKEHILREPENFCMDFWACQTAHCIAGWAALLDGWNPIRLHALWGTNDVRLLAWPPIAVAAMNALEIEETQAACLFNAPQWPDDLARKMRKTFNPNAQAEIAAEAIDRFIAKYSEQPESPESLPVEVEEPELIFA
jgi:hypothetical protein